MVLRQYDTDPERKVLNTNEPDDRISLVVKTDEAIRRQMRSSKYESVEFTESSLDYGDPYEDEDLLSGGKTPKVTAVFDTGYDGKPNYFDPSASYVEQFNGFESLDRTSDMGPLSGESFSTPRFFSNPVDLLIGCIVFCLIIVLEIVGLIII